MIFKFLVLAVFINTIAARENLNPRECLGHGENMESPNGCFQLTMQHDGNLVLYRKRNNEAIWNSGTPRSCTNRACMQGDGNFVTYDCHNIATWNSGTPNNEGSSLRLQNDGNIVIYAWNSNRAIWASNSQTSC